MSIGRGLRRRQKNRWVRKMKIIQSLLAEIERQKNILDRLKVFHSRMNNDIIGATEVRPGGYYRSRGLDVILKFNRPLTRDDIDRNNEISRWLNESFIIRLYALLDSHKIFSPRIDDALDGNQELDILRRLRRILAHSLGKYHPDVPYQMKLVNRLISHFGLQIVDPKEFPLDIDKVIDPLIKGCKKYVKGKFAKKGSETE
jgi:hypothetical protein